MIPPTRSPFELASKLNDLMAQTPEEVLSFVLPLLSHAHAYIYKEAAIIFGRLLEQMGAEAIFLYIKKHSLPIPDSLLSALLECYLTKPPQEMEQEDVIFLMLAGADSQFDVIYQNAMLLFDRFIHSEGWIDCLVTFMQEYDPDNWADNIPAAFLQVICHKFSQKAQQGECLEIAALLAKKALERRLCSPSVVQLFKILGEVNPDFANFFSASLETLNHPSGFIRESFQHFFYTFIAEDDGFDVFMALLKRQKNERWFQDVPLFLLPLIFEKLHEEVHKGHRYDEAVTAILAGSLLTGPSAICLQASSLFEVLIQNEPGLDHFIAMMKDKEKDLWFHKIPDSLLTAFFEQLKKKILRGQFFDAITAVTTVTAKAPMGNNLGIIAKLDERRSPDPGRHFAKFQGAFPKGPQTRRVQENALSLFHALIQEDRGFDAYLEHVQSQNPEKWFQLLPKILERPIIQKFTGRVRQGNFEGTAAVLKQACLPGSAISFAHLEISEELCKLFEALVEHGQSPDEAIFANFSDNGLLYRDGPLQALMKQEESLNSLLCFIKAHQIHWWQKTNNPKLRELLVQKICEEIEQGQACNQALSLTKALLSSSCHSIFINPSFKGLAETLIAKDLFLEQLLNLLNQAAAVYYEGSCPSEIYEDSKKLFNIIIRKETGLVIVINNVAYLKNLFLNPLLFLELLLRVDELILNRERYEDVLCLIAVGKAHRIESIRQKAVQQEEKLNYFRRSQIKSSRPYIPCEAE